MSHENQKQVFKRQRNPILQYKSSFAIFVIILLLNLLAFNLQSNAQELSDEEESIKDLDARILKIIDETELPGMIGAIVYGDEIIWLGAHGIANKESEISVTNETLFRLGSITKTITALSILKLVDNNELKLTSLISDVAPQVKINNPWSKTSPIRIVHLLEHTAGLMDIDYRANTLEQNFTILQAIEFNSNTLHIQWEPGFRFAYSNIGPVIAALALENLTGETYEKFVDRVIFKPIGMKSATFITDDRVAYSYDMNGLRIPHEHMSVPPSGALNATNFDMAQLLRMFNQRGTINNASFIHPELISRMETPSSSLAARKGLRAGFGLGNYTIQREGYVFQGHEGSIEGFSSIFAYLPENSRGYFFSMNQPNSVAGQRIDKELIAFVTKNITPPKPIDRIIQPESNLKTFEGYYKLDSSHILLDIEQAERTTIRYKEGKLYFKPQNKQEIELIPVGNNQFRILNYTLPTVMFTINGDNKVFLQSGRTMWEKISFWEAYSRSVIVGCITLILSCILLFWLIRFLRQRF